ncbi:PLDc N-terminal domain-containing protein [Curtobacterium sp. NPDC089991]|uniref:PLDc N-terminal domain-containing protein n=1 Tax=Curtobacterium sp. NPDC089991 TaxID=3363969 RepID=UPI00381587A8
MSPLVPTALDGAAMSVCILGLLLALAALTSLIRAASLTGRHLLAWALVVLFVPFVGPVSWFAVRFRRSRQRFQNLDDDA